VSIRYSSNLAAQLWSHARHTGIPWPANAPSAAIALLMGRASFLGCGLLTGGRDRAGDVVEEIP
jgi:hypothetical protein